MMLTPPKDFVNTNGRTPTTVALVTVVRSSLKRRVPKAFPIGRTRRARRDRLVKRSVDTIIQLINEKVNRRGGNRGRRDIGSKAGLKGSRKRDKGRDIKRAGF